MLGKGTPELDLLRANLGDGAADEILVSAATDFMLYTVYY